jgi:2-amino-4-hydroxy-6-hydroxymethyldihydropteridine diphosphokinase
MAGVRVWVSVGSNLAREPSLRAGLAALQARYGTLTVSPVYESAAVGSPGPPFYNLVVGFGTDREPAALAADLRAVEAELGRVRGADRFAPRTLDLDLLTWGDRVQAGPPQLPRGEILEYAFVLGPLADVAGGEVHPPSGRTYAELWAAFDRAAQPMHRVPFPWPAGG